MRPALVLAIAAVLAARAAHAAPADTTDPHDDERARELETIEVTAVPLPRNAEQLVAPATVIAGEELDRVKSATLGETVSQVPGVQSTSFGPGVGRPVIRGLDGPRVGVLANGLASGDVSTISQDHGVTIEPFLADQIEILKGPSTLLYGSGAIGGVVNVVDGRIHERAHDGVSGRGELRGADGTGERTGMFRVDGGAGPLMLHADGLRRRLDDIEVFDGELPNSFVETDAGGLGASLVGDEGFFGFSVSRYTSDYGNPAEPGGPAEGEPGVSLELEQTRYELKAGLDTDVGIVDRVRASVGFTDYEHVELEGDEVGTQFDSDQREGRLTLAHLPLAGWTGALGVQFLDRRFEAIGEEAFVPRTETEGFGVFLVEEREWDRFTLELGARSDRQRSTPEGDARRRFTPLSLSAGGRFEVSPALHLTVNLDRAERAPAEEELFAFGPHVATNSFEIGDPTFDVERGNQLEFGFHYHADRVELEASVYASRFDDFIYLADTGEIEDELPVRQWTQDDARFRGAEAEARFVLVDDASGRLNLRAWGDVVDAELEDGGELPRIAPARLGLGLEWRSDAWRAGVGAVRWFEQDDVTAFETTTDGFTMVDAQLAYAFRFSDGPELEVFLDGRNLLDEEARLATSYIKDTAPLAGRTIAVGVRAFF